jgi:hypothetical protein
MLKWPLLAIAVSIRLQCRTVDTDFNPVRLRIFCTGIDQNLEETIIGISKDALALRFSALDFPAISIGRNAGQLCT